jgi:hypothetical protein
MTLKRQMFVAAAKTARQRLLTNRSKYAAAFWDTKTVGINEGGDTRFAHRLYNRREAQEGATCAPFETGKAIFGIRYKL